MPDFIHNGENPIPVTLADWKPKLNAQGEARLRLDFELPLSDEVIALLPKQIQKQAKNVADVANGVARCPIDAEFDQAIECYLTPGNSVPSQAFSPVKLQGFNIWRPTLKEGDTKELFLDFHTTVSAGGVEGEALAGWLLRYMRKTLFIRTHEVQGVLPGMDAPEKPARKRSGKDAAANEPIQ